MKTRFVTRFLIPMIITILGFGLLVYPTFTEWTYAGFQDQLERSTQVDKPVSGQADDNGISLPAETVAKLLIPRIEVEAFVLPGTTGKVLKTGPGHYPETALPGTPGNSAIAGHRTMYGHTFRRLDELDAGDEVIVLTNAGRFTYRVIAKKRVPPTDLSVLESSEVSKITLTTCDPVGSARRRLIVVAQLAEG